MHNIDRRKFIGKTALAGIGLAGAGAVLSSCKRNDNAKFEDCLRFSMVLRKGRN